MLQPDPGFEVHPVSVRGLPARCRQPKLMKSSLGWHPGTFPWCVHTLRRLTPRRQPYRLTTASAFLPFTTPPASTRPERERSNRLLLVASTPNLPPHPTLSHPGFPTDLQNGSSAPPAGISSCSDTTTPTASPPLGGCACLGFFGPLHLPVAASRRWVPRSPENALRRHRTPSPLAVGFPARSVCDVHDAVVIDPTDSLPTPQSSGTDRHDASLRQHRLLAERPYAPLVPAGPWDFPSAGLSTSSALPQALTVMAPASRQGRRSPPVPFPPLRRAAE
jgi:hypothetical protein